MLKLLFKGFCYSLLFFGISIAEEINIQSKVAYIKKMQEEIMIVLEKDGITLPQIKQTLVDKYSKEIDFEWSGRMAIGKFWKTLNEIEQKEYIEEYRRLLAYTWLPRLNYNRKNGVTVKIKDEIIPINEKDDNVMILVTLPDSKTYEIFLRVRQFPDGKFRLLNVVAEGVDLTMSYRAQFDDYIEKNGSAQKLLQYIKEINKKSEKTVDFVVK